MYIKERGEMKKMCWPKLLKQIKRSRESMVWITLGSKFKLLDDGKDLMQIYKLQEMFMG